MEIEVTGLRIRIGEAEFDLTIDQAQELYYKLGNIFSEELDECEEIERPVVPSIPYYPYSPYYPYKWTSDNTKNPFPYEVKITCTK